MKLKPTPKDEKAMAKFAKQIRHKMNHCEKCKRYIGSAYNLCDKCFNFPTK